ncbi:MAG TPA: DUF4032 domain-containing protein [Herpetosiphonaceae bacterium]
MDEYQRHHVEQAFRRARLQAWISGIRGRWGRRLTELVSFPDVRARILVRGQRDLGLRLVALHQIVGSEGRRGDFDRQFAPRRSHTRDRWERIDLARLEDRGLPPVELIQVGEIYFVRDGHHRLSVARQAGQQEIEAHVVELTSNVPLTATLDQRDLVRKGAQSAFVEHAGIVRALPEADVPVDASEPATYDALLHHIDTHGYYLGQAQGTPVSRETAGVHWYQTLYQPMITAIRHWNMRSAFRARTESDLYLRLMDHRHYLTEQTGHDPGPDAALLDYIKHLGSRQARRQVTRHLASTHHQAEADVTRIANAGDGVPGWWRWRHRPIGLVRRLIPLLRWLQGITRSPDPAAENHLQPER